MGALFDEHARVLIRVVVIDDHVLLRQGVCEMLNKDADFEVIAEADDERVAISLCVELKPNIALVDLDLECSAMDIAKQLLRNAPDVHVVLYGGSSEEKQLLEAVRIGVHGYLQKTLSIKDLKQALRAVYCGERVLGGNKAVTQMVLGFHRLAQEQNRLNWGLSAKDIDLVRLAAQGFTNKEIGRQVFWSEVQVKRKMQEIYRKLNVSDRAQAVAEAMRHSLI